jgi:hypothetical protein
MLTALRGLLSSRRVFALLLATCCANSSAQTVRGIVHNGTNGKAALGDTILLMNGTHEIGRAVSGKNGDFRFAPDLSAVASPDALKVRALHHSVSYEQPIRIGVAADVTVYDASARVEGLSESLRIFQFESRVADRLEVTELHAIQNDSWPQRTSIDPEGFDLTLPEGSRNLSVTIAEADGQGAKLLVADPSEKNGPYKFGVPLKPGLTKYVVSYELPYGHPLPFRRSSQYFVQKTFIVLPMSMSFAPLGARQFNSVPDQTGAQVRQIDSLAKNNLMAFRIAGTGILAQAFRPIGGQNESTRKTLPSLPANAEPLPADASQTSSAPNALVQKVPQLASHPVPANQSLRNWAASVFIFLMLGSFIAWKVSHAKHHRPAA